MLLLLQKAFVAAVGSSLLFGGDYPSVVMGSSSLRHQRRYLNSNTNTNTSSSSSCENPSLICSNGGFIERVALGYDDGSFYLPDWTGGTSEAVLPYSIDQCLDPDNVTIVQDPMPGYHFVGEQKVTVSLSLGGNDDTSCTFMLELVDRTPPTIEVTGVEMSNSYLVPDYPMIVASATDNVDSNPNVTLLVDQSSYIVGQPLTVGWHVATVVATDSSGNSAFEEIFFEIRSSPLLGGNLSVLEFMCNEGPDGSGFAEFAANISLTSTDFDVSTIDYANLWIRNENHFSLNRQVLRPYQVSLIGTNNEEVILHYEAHFGDEAIIGCPAGDDGAGYLEITGSGIDGDVYDYEIEAALSPPSNAERRMMSWFEYPWFLQKLTPTSAPTEDGSSSPVSTSTSLRSDGSVPSTAPTTATPESAPTTLPSLFTPEPTPSKSPVTSTSLPTSSEYPTSITTGPTTSTSTESPTTLPSSTPTIGPSSTPTIGPTSTPTIGPTYSVFPTTLPSADPTSGPTTSVYPTTRPSSTPTLEPTASVYPTTGPSSAPTPCLCKCEWKSKIQVNKKDGFVRDTQDNTCIGGYRGGSLWVIARGANIGGNGFVQDDCTGQASLAKSATSNAVYEIWLEKGDKEKCDPRIQCRFIPRFTASVSVNEPGHAHVDGLIDIASTCGSTRAVGAIAVGDNVRPSVSFSVGAEISKDGPKVSAGVSVTTEFPSSDEHEKTFQGNLVNSVNTDYVMISVVTASTMDLLADAHLFNIYADAHGDIKDSDPGIFVTATNQNDECDGEGFEFKRTTGKAS